MSNPHTLVSEERPLPLPPGVAPNGLPQQLVTLHQALPPLLVEVAGCALEREPNGRVVQRYLLQVWGLLMKTDRLHAIVTAAERDCFHPTLRGKDTTLTHTNPHIPNRRAESHDNLNTHGWVVGTNTYSKAQGYKSVSWVLRCIAPSVSGLAIGVVPKNLSLTFARVVGIGHMACFQEGFFGWSSTEGCMVYGGEHGFDFQSTDHDCRIFHEENAECEVKIDLETGNLTCTRLTGVRHTHTYTHTVPVSDGEAYRVCLDMCKDVCVELVRCETEFL